MPHHPDLLIVLTTGKQDRGTRATLAFTWGCAALAMGQSVSMYLTMDGTVWAMRDATRGVTVDGFEPLANYVEQFLAMGGRLLACAPCTEFYCSQDRPRVQEVLVEGATLTGLASIVALQGPGTRVVTF